MALRFSGRSRMSQVMPSAFSILMFSYASSAIQPVLPITGAIISRRSAAGPFPRSRPPDFHDSVVRVSATFGHYKLPPGTDDDEPVEGIPVVAVSKRNGGVDRQKRYLIAGGPAAVAAGAPGETRTPTPLWETDFESLGVNVSILLGRQNSPVFQAVIGIFDLFAAAHLTGTFSQLPCSITQELHRLLNSSVQSHLCRPMSVAPSPADNDEGAEGLVAMERKLTRLLIEYDELEPYQGLDRRQEGQAQGAEGRHGL